jgi:hypothetical protein
MSANTGKRREALRTFDIIINGAKLNGSMPGHSMA